MAWTSLSTMKPWPFPSIRRSGEPAMSRPKRSGERLSAGTPATGVIGAAREVARRSPTMTFSQQGRWSSSSAAEQPPGCSTQVCRHSRTQDRGSSRRGSCLVCRLRSGRKTRTSTGARAKQARLAKPEADRVEFLEQKLLQVEKRDRLAAFVASFESQAGHPDDERHRDFKSGVQRRLAGMNARLLPEAIARELVAFEAFTPTQAGGHESGSDAQS